MEELILLELSGQVTKLLESRGFNEIKVTPDVPNRTIWMGGDAMRIELAVIPTPQMDKSLVELHIGTYLEYGYFPQGILDNIAGFGDTDEEKVLSLVNNYLNTTFKTILNSLECVYDKGCDIVLGDYHWHTSLGGLYLLGKWQTPPDERDFYNLLIDILPEHFSSKQRIQSLKCYVARVGGKGDCIAECLLNNELWEEGAARLRQYAQAWEGKSFMAVKQLIVFRLCDKVH